MATNKTYVELNVYAKLVKARNMFIELGVKKTGINRHLEFKYFELEDIVPAITKISQELGLLFITSFSNEYAKLVVINTDKPEEQIEFTSPMKDIDSIESKAGGKITNAIQNLGSVETYQRRYLYFMALDIVEADEFDKSVREGVEEKNTEIKTSVKAATKKASKKVPLSAEQRAEIKDEIVNAEGQAEPLQIEALKNIMQQLLDIDPEREELIQEIVIKTDKLTNITKTACNELINHLADLLNSYQVVKQADSDEE